ncbi:MAG: thioredoxin [Bacteroidota bacterium]
MALELTDNNFDVEVTESGKLAVVDFWAVWCGPCRMLAPVIEALAEENVDVVVGKLDVDNNPEISQRYGIRSLPTVLLLRDGEIVDKQIGVTTKAVLQDKIDQHYVKS